MAEEAKRIIVVTGGSRGIGRSICLSFAGNDTRIYFNYYSPDPDAEAVFAAETEKLVAEKGGSAKGIFANVSDEKDVAKFFEQIMDESERVDVLINNAGITRDGFIVRMKETDWDDVLNINLKGAFFCIKIAGKLMMKQRSGCIINMASVVGVTGNAGQANYSASKAGLIGLTKSTAKELAPRGITVNAIAPGFIETDMTAVLPEDIKKEMLDQIPLGRAGKPEDIASVAVFLASEAASYITGQVIHVSGGMYT
ncbi:MAG: 3-oxoacyl-[acyl-carrier-protein] reductase [Deltaproteobacteria bacterium]|nr:3-oxoacyl-[acyl-carrier-protein] reductase [Deltaproteobacteria bacterium]MBW1983216.1 3-oxoacyl-[acyl-carrier-protein] reductase [Deltaproteobacteria bacterium]MBW2181511.1 3-oxoacyl-[acyl-carrier-protein] reductase [Deltaproteobacteria bacterium]